MFTEFLQLDMYYCITDCVWLLTQSSLFIVSQY